MQDVEVELASAGSAQVTLPELLEDFADVTPGWQYLEEDSNLYESLRGGDACVIRGKCGAEGTADFAFAGSDPPRRFWLSAICPPDGTCLLEGDARLHFVHEFESAFRRYLQAHKVSADVRVRADVSTL